MYIQTFESFVKEQQVKISTSDDKTLPGNTSLIQVMQKHKGLIDIDDKSLKEFIVRLMIECKKEEIKNITTLQVKQFLRVMIPNVNLKQLNVSEIMKELRRMEVIKQTDTNSIKGKKYAIYNFDKNSTKLLASALKQLS